MKHSYTIKINFRGGIVSPGDLFNILVAAGKVGITAVRFGLRQQLLMDVAVEDFSSLSEELSLLNVPFEKDEDLFPNIVSSYPAEEVFINNTWLSEGVYKDIFDLIDYQPKFKINISDSNQSFTPLLTGNINWVASASQHFWSLFIRFPKTNVVYEWKEMVYTNDVARMSKHIESLILESPQSFIDNPEANGDLLFEMVRAGNYITRPSEKAAKLPAFNLPYYEGLNRYNDKYWLGIYRRDELFTVSFLKDICKLCLQTKVGQLCTTPWKSLIIKSIEEKDRQSWNNLLAANSINVRHAANELNFQVEDNCEEGLALKQYLVKHLNDDDVRTFGVCIGIKTRKKSEVFSSILVRRRPLISLFGLELIHVYDILCAHDFNPNERTGFVYSSGNPKALLPEQLRRAILSFYSHQASHRKQQETVLVKKETPVKSVAAVHVHQCPGCLTVYDEVFGDPDNNIPAGIKFEHLPHGYNCPLCETPKKEFIIVDKSSLSLQAI